MAWVGTAVYDLGTGIGESLPLAVETISIVGSVTLEFFL